MVYFKATMLLTNSSSTRLEPISSYISYKSQTTRSTSEASSRDRASAISFATFSPVDSTSPQSSHSVYSAPYYPTYSLPSLSTVQSSSASLVSHASVTSSSGSGTRTSLSRYSQSYIPMTYTSTATVYKTQTSSDVTYTQPYIITDSSTTITTGIITTGTSRSTGAITTDMAYYNQHILASHHSSSSLSRGAIAGAVVGAILGAGALLFIIFCCCRRKQRVTDTEKSVFNPFSRRANPQLPTSQPPRFDYSEKYHNNTQEDLLGLSDLRQGLLQNQVVEPPTRLANVAASPSPPPSPSEVINSPTMETFDETPAAREERLMDVVYEEQDPSEQDGQDVFAPTYKSSRYDRYNVGISMPPGSYPPKRKPAPPPPRKSGYVVQDTLSSMQFRPQSDHSLSSISFTDDESV